MPSELIATLPPADEFRRVLGLTVILGTVAFGVCGLILAGFIHSLHRESEEGKIQLTRTSAWWLAALIASLLACSAIFMWFSFR